MTSGEGPGTPLHSVILAKKVNVTIAAKENGDGLCFTSAALLAGRRLLRFAVFPPPARFYFMPQSVVDHNAAASQQ